MDNVEYDVIRYIVKNYGKTDDVKLRYFINSKNKIASCQQFIDLIAEYNIWRSPRNDGEIKKIDFDEKNLLKNILTSKLFYGFWSVKNKITFKNIISNIYYLDKKVFEVNSFDRYFPEKFPSYRYNYNLCDTHCNCNDKKSLVLSNIHSINNSKKIKFPSIKK